MTPDQFYAALAQTKMQPESKAAQAAYYVLVEGKPVAVAAKLMNTSHTSTSKAVSRIQSI